MGFCYVVAVGPAQLEEGFDKGLNQGTFVATTRILTEYSKSNDPQAVDLSSIGNTLRTTNEEHRSKGNPSATTAYIDQLVKDIDSYQMAYTKGDLVQAKSILKNQISKSVQPLNKALEEAVKKSDERRKDGKDLRRLVSISFFVFSILGIMSAISLISNYINDAESDFSILERRLARTSIRPLSEFIQNKVNPDKDSDDAKNLSKVVYLSIAQPMLVCTNDRWKPFTFSSLDLAEEIRLAEGYAYCISNGESKFELPPDGTCMAEIEHHSVSHAIVQWMEQIVRHQKAKTFACNSEWINQSWIITLSTAGDPVHESVINGYRDVMSKKEGLTTKHNDELDFVRDALRRAFDSIQVTHDNGNLNLVMTFKPKSA